MTLADKIAAYLAGTGRALTAQEIALGISARTADVLEVLRSDARFYGPVRVPGRSPFIRAYFYGDPPVDRRKAALTEPGSLDTRQTAGALPGRAEASRLRERARSTLKASFVGSVGSRALEPGERALNGFIRFSTAWLPQPSPAHSLGADGKEGR